MGIETEIAWTDSTFNPWWGCQRVSPGCEHCYAETFAKRVGLQVWGPKQERRFFGDKHWREPLRWNEQAAKTGVRRRVFCASMADVFEDRPDLLEPRATLWRLIEITPWLDWLVLTKRPENAARLATLAADAASATATAWPANVWLGTTVEDQRRADERIPHLLRVPAAVRFLSCEPLLEAVQLRHLDVDRAGDPQWCQIDALTGRHTDMARPCPDVPRVHWVIVGGESGHHARPFDVAWARSLVSQCREAGTAVFVKQLGAHPFADGFEQRLKDKKGGDMSEWPEDLRVREFPR